MTFILILFVMLNFFFYKEHDFFSALTKVDPEQKLLLPKSNPPDSDPKGDSDSLQDHQSRQRKLMRYQKHLPLF
ncbi:unnamed protein product, partial [Arabidopsis halleri]